MHGSPEVGGVGGAPATQVPLPLHIDVPLQKEPSSQLTVFGSGGLLHPATASQRFFVHGFESTQLRGVPAWHAPVAGTQVSSPSHTLLFVHTTVVVLTHPVALQVSVVQRLLSVHP